MEFLLLLLLFKIWNSERVEKSGKKNWEKNEKTRRLVNFPMCRWRVTSYRSRQQQYIYEMHNFEFRFVCERAIVFFVVVHESPFIVSYDCWAVKCAEMLCHTSRSINGWMNEWTIHRITRALQTMTIWSCQTQSNSSYLHRPVDWWCALFTTPKWMGSVGGVLTAHRSIKYNVVCRFFFRFQRILLCCYYRIVADENDKTISCPICK